MDEETKIYISQLEDEILRLKNSNKSLKNNNKKLLISFNKVNSQLAQYKRRYGKLTIS